MKDKEKVKEYNKQYWIKNRDRLLPMVRARSIKWCKDNREKRNKRDRDIRLIREHPNKNATKRYRIKIKKECIDAYGGKCCCCGENHLDMLAIDHKFENGSEHRKTFKQGGGAIHSLLKKQDYPDSYQCLCHNCNYSKYRNNGKCIHEIEREINFVDYQI